MAFGKPLFDLKIELWQSKELKTLRKKFLKKGAFSKLFKNAMYQTLLKHWKERIPIRFTDKAYTEFPTKFRKTGSRRRPPLTYTGALKRKITKEAPIIRVGSKKSSIVMKYTRPDPLTRKRAKNRARYLIQFKKMNPKAAYRQAFGARSYNAETKLYVQTRLGFLSNKEENLLAKIIENQIKRDLRKMDKASGRK